MYKTIFSVISLVSLCLYSVVAKSETINQSSANITVLRTFPTGVAIAFPGQLAWNAVVVNPSNCNVETNPEIPIQEEYAVLDCTVELQNAIKTQMPQIAAPIAGKFLVPAALEILNGIESSSTRFSVRDYSCSLQEVQTASREAALPMSSGIGFFFGNTIRTVATEDLTVNARARSRTGETLLIHRFLAPAFCWNGSTSSTMHSNYAFRPYLEYVDTNRTIFRTWDNVNSDYIISEGSARSFDRSASILQ
jgi:hypothetical protein